MPHELVTGRATLLATWKHSAFVGINMQGTRRFFRAAVIAHTPTTQRDFRTYYHEPEQHAYIEEQRFWLVHDLERFPSMLTKGEFGPDATQQQGADVEATKEVVAEKALGDGWATDLRNPHNWPARKRWSTVSGFLSTMSVCPQWHPPGCDCFVV